MNAVNDDDVTIQRMGDFEPLIGSDEMIEVEEMEKDVGVRRRLMYATLARNSDEIYEMAESNTEVTEKLFNEINSYIEDLKILLEMSVCASSRLLSSLSCIDDKKKCEELVNQWADATSIDISSDEFR